MTRGVSRRLPFHCLHDIVMKLQTYFAIQGTLGQVGKHLLRKRTVSNCCAEKQANDSLGVEHLLWCRHLLHYENTVTSFATSRSDIIRHGKEEVADVSKYSYENNSNMQIQIQIQHILKFRSCLKISVHKQKVNG